MCHDIGVIVLGSLYSGFQLILSILHAIEWIVHRGHPTSCEHFYLRGSLHQLLRTRRNTSARPSAIMATPTRSIKLVVALLSRGNSLIKRKSPWPEVWVIMAPEG